MLVLCLVFFAYRVSCVACSVLRFVCCTLRGVVAFHALCVLFVVCYGAMFRVLCFLCIVCCVMRFEFRLFVVRHVLCFFCFVHCVA